MKKLIPLATDSVEFKLDTCKRRITDLKRLGNAITEWSDDVVEQMHAEKN